MGYGAYGLHALAIIYRQRVL